MSRFPAEFIQAIPKTDLHLHLDGSLRIGTLIDLAQEAGVALPAQDEKDCGNEYSKTSTRTSRNTCKASH